MEYPHLHPSWHTVRDITKEEYEELFPKCFTISNEGRMNPIKDADEKSSKEVLKYLLIHEQLYIKD